jgi:hypothetical protein
MDRQTTWTITIDTEEGLPPSFFHQFEGQPLRCAPIRFNFVSDKSDGAGVARRILEWLQHSAPEPCDVGDSVLNGKEAREALEECTSGKVGSLVAFEGGIKSDGVVLIHLSSSEASGGRLPRRTLSKGAGRLPCSRHCSGPCYCSQEECYACQCRVENPWVGIAVFFAIVLGGVIEAAVGSGKRESLNEGLLYALLVAVVIFLDNVFRQPARPRPRCWPCSAGTASSTPSPAGASSSVLTRPTCPPAFLFDASLETLRIRHFLAQLLLCLIFAVRWAVLLSRRSSA